MTDAEKEFFAKAAAAEPAAKQRFYWPVIGIAGLIVGVTAVGMYARTQGKPVPAAELQNRVAPAPAAPAVADVIEKKDNVAKIEETEDEKEIYDFISGYNAEGNPAGRDMYMRKNSQRLSNRSINCSAVLTSVKIEKYLGHWVDGQRVFNDKEVNGIKVPDFKDDSEVLSIYCYMQKFVDNKKLRCEFVLYADINNAIIHCSAGTPITFKAQIKD